MELKDTIDELKIYRGSDYYITDKLFIRQPTLGEIADYGEIAYFNMVHTLCSVGADLKWQLDDIGIDYMKVSDFELFYSVIARSFSKNETSILFGDIIDFSKMKVMYHKNIQENVLVQFFDDEEPLIIDGYVYSLMINTIRKMHRIQRNNEIPGNEATRRVFIEEARENYENNKDKPQRPVLLPLISTMVNSAGFKRDDKTVFDMKLYAFMDGVMRIKKIKNADLLLQSGYSGFGINIKKIDKNEINWLGELE